MPVRFRPGPPAPACTPRRARSGALLALGLLLACGSSEPGAAVVSVSGSVLGAEGAAWRAQLARFEAEQPGTRVRVLRTPDAADQRHQLYVQWLNARTPDPDVLQLDVIWTAELAAAGWILPLERFAPASDDFFPAPLAAARWHGRLYAVPWFVDVGLLYWRRDLLARAPRSFAELEAAALAARRSAGVPYGLVWPGFRYEGLVTVFVEYLGGFGGRILDGQGRVVVDAAPAVRALEAMRAAIESGLVPREVLGWQEEPTRFAFQNGQAVLMRNWPYAYPLLQDRAQSRVAGRFGVATLPAAPEGAPTSALGGQLLAINASSDVPELAFALIEFLTRPEEMRARARALGQYPPRPSLYHGDALAGALPIDPARARALIEAAVPRPVTPLYAELSEVLQIHLHRALSGQETPRDALASAASQMRQRLARAGLAPADPAP